MTMRTSACDRYNVLVPVRLCAATVVVAALAAGLSSPGMAAPNRKGIDLRIVVRQVGPNPVTVGNETYVTIQVQNYGTQDADSSTLRIVVPEQLRMRSANVIPPWGGCAPARAAWRCQLGPMPACPAPCHAAPIQIEFRAQAVKPGAAVVRLIAASNATDAHPADNRRSIRIRVRPGPSKADLSVTFEPGAEPQAGIASPLEFTIHNAGPTAADAIRMVLRVTTEGRFVGVDLRNSPFKDCEPTDEDTKVVLCTLRFLQAGGSASVRLEVVLREGQARIELGVRAATKDPNAGNNSLVVSPTVVPPSKTADLGVAVRGPQSARVGESITYTVSVTNYGPDPAEDVVFGTAVFGEEGPIDVTINSIESNQGTCSLGGGCSLGSIPAGTTVTVTIVATFRSAGTAHFLALADGTDDAYDPGRYEPTPPGHPNGSGATTIVTT